MLEWVAGVDEGWVEELGRISFMDDGRILSCFCINVAYEGGSGRTPYWTVG